MERVFGRPKGTLSGTVAVPGDKSLSHRAILFAAMAEGTSRFEGVLASDDVRSTIGAVSALGAQVDVESDADGLLSGTVRGWGRRGPSTPAAPIDCGNSGTTARLLLGVLAGWPIAATLTGDASLSRRPMRRVIDPLAEMGASFSASEAGTLPVTVTGSDDLRAIEYPSPVASAQVKTAVLLAGLRAHGRTTVSEPALSRDHTERLLPAFGVDVERDGLAVSLTGPAELAATPLSVPRDPSSAAFMTAAALLVPGSAVELPGVSLNPTRLGFVDVLQRMGAALTVVPGDSIGLEPVGTLRVQDSGALEATVVTATEVPSLVDEVPVLALVACAAQGTTRFEGVGELRVKESDRLAAIHEGLSALGATVRSGEDWLEIDGPAQLHGATLDSRGDHRLAMTWALAGLVSDGDVTVTSFEAIDVSYPRFAEDLAALGA